MPLNSIISKYIYFVTFIESSIIFLLYFIIYALVQDPWFTDLFPQLFVYLTVCITENNSFVINLSRKKFVINY